MEDNARPHRAREVNAFLEEQGIERLVWPPNSPDLNPIEHLWDQLKQSVYARVNDDTTLADLPLIIQQEWAAIPKQRVTRLINSMRRRCQAVIDIHGGYTRATEDIL